MFILIASCNDPSTPTAQIRTCNWETKTPEQRRFADITNTPERRTKQNQFKTPQSHRKRRNETPPKYLSKIGGPSIKTNKDPQSLLQMYAQKNGDLSPVRKGKVPGASVKGFYYTDDFVAVVKPEEERETLNNEKEFYDAFGAPNYPASFITPLCHATLNQEIHPTNNDNLVSVVSSRDSSVVSSLDSSFEAFEEEPETNAVIIYPKCPGQSFFEFLSKAPDQDDEKYCDAVLDAIKEIHQKGYAHGDLHPGNIFVHKDERFGKTRIRAFFIDLDKTTRNATVAQMRGDANRLGEKLLEGLRSTSNQGKIQKMIKKMRQYTSEIPSAQKK